MAGKAGKGTCLSFFLGKVRPVLHPSFVVKGNWQVSEPPRRDRMYIGQERSCHTNVPSASPWPRPALRAARSWERPREPP
jgi:hypothetical protein